MKSPKSVQTHSNASLTYHSKFPAGKISVQPSKPANTQADLAKAYTPGVAEPVRAIAADPALSYAYTNRGNLVAVISNGTAVLGLGNVGALASKPVMEGKSVLFKRFAGIDAYDLELNQTDPDKFIEAVAALEPTFGGINLEDIAAPECFYIETELKKRMNIPVFHDDQHGTAIIAVAALLNALEIVGKKIANAKIVISGAGAAGIRCAEHIERLGGKRANITLCDSRGVITKERAAAKGFDAMKKRFARVTAAESLEDAVMNADVFIGVSAPNVLNADMVRTMAANPIVFAMANPDPEIPYKEAKAARPDLIFATGRSDYPNQINNILGFPFVFRGALDVRATDITPNMQVAATKALAKLAHETVPASVKRAYNVKHMQFGPEYIVPKPFDPRVLPEVSVAVAKAAISDGVAKGKVSLVRYRGDLQKLSLKLIRQYS